MSRSGRRAIVRVTRNLCYCKFFRSIPKDMIELQRVTKFKLDLTLGDRLM